MLSCWWPCCVFSFATQKAHTPHRSSKCSTWDFSLAVSESSFVTSSSTWLWFWWACCCYCDCLFLAGSWARHDDCVSCRAKGTVGVTGLGLGLGQRGCPWADMVLQAAGAAGRRVLLFDGFHLRRLAFLFTDARRFLQRCTWYSYRYM